MIKEITARDLDPVKFISEQVNEISTIVGDGIAIKALSGGVDSSTVTMLGHKALGDRLKTVFIQNGLMREGEPERVADTFKKLGVHIEIVDARKEFLFALKGITDPEEKREAITQAFYKDVFGRIVRDSGARFLLQGTILTDIDETVAGIKRQHNVFEQLGIDPEEAFGYKIIEPLIRLQRDHHAVARDIARERLEAGEHRAAEVDDDVSGAGGQTLPGAQIEGHPLPAPVVDVQPDGHEGLRARVVGDALLLSVAGDMFSVDRTAGVLPEHHVLRGQRTNRAQDLRLLVAHEARLQRGRQLHGGDAEQLDEVVLQDVSERAHPVVEGAASLYAEVLRDRDLDALDPVPVPQRLEDRVGEPE